MSFFNKLKEGLAKTKGNIDEKINNVFGLENEETIIEPEEQLVSFENCKKGYLAKSI